MGWVLIATVLTFTPWLGVIRNPGQGWSAAGGASRFAELDAVVNVGAGYHRYQWNWLEPQDGCYDWSMLDRDIEFFAAKGLPFGFRIMCANYHSPGRECSPQWVFEKGAKNFVFAGIPYVLPDGTMTRDHVTPVFDDPLFIEAHRRFIEALAKRYDGDPRISGVDIGSFGNWGERHCWELWPKGTGAKQMQKVSAAVRRQYADMYLSNFRKTSLQFLSGDVEMLKYSAGASGFNVGLRRDGVGDPDLEWCGDERYAIFPQMADVWKHRPVWFEWWAVCTDFGRPGTFQEKWTIPEPIDWMLKNHVSLVNTTPFNPVRCKAELPDVYPLLKKIDLFAGARLVVESATLARDGLCLSIKLTGSNKGSSRIHLPYVAEYVFFDGSGRVVNTIPSAFDPCAVLPGRFDHEERILLPESLSQGVSLRLRVRHSSDVLADFRWAVKEVDAQGALLLGEVSSVGVPCCGGCE